MQLPAYAEMEDDALIHQVQKGNEHAFELLLDRHVHLIRAFLALKAPVPHLVDELAHETFVFAFRNIRDFTPGTSLSSWLRAIAWTLLRREVQRFSRDQANQARFAAQHICETFQTEREPSPPHELEHLEYCLQRIPSRLRELLTLKYQEDVDTEQIARQFRRTASWVYTSLFRLRQQLKDCIEQRLRSEQA